MLLLNKQLHLLKRDISYLGYVRHNPAVVFSFEKIKHIEKVYKNMTLSNYEIKYHPYNNHFKLERDVGKQGYNAYYIETTTCHSITTYLSHHNVDMFIVCDVIEDQDDNMLLMCENSKNIEF